MISTKTRSYLESAVRKLGPERAYDALRAFDNDPERGGGPNGWRYCVLARAYGTVGALDDLGTQMESVRVKRQWATTVVADILGFTDREVIAVTRAYDGDYGPEYSILLKYLLVKEAGKLSTAPAESLELVLTPAGRRSEGGE